MNLDKILKNIDVKKLKYKNTNLTYEEILQREIRRFKDILQKHIEAYYNSYTPVMYQRGRAGGNLLNSLTVDDMVKISANGKELTCTLRINENAIHQSIGYGDDHLSNAFWLINDGYSVKKDVWFKDIHHFGYFEGAHYVEDAVDEFNRTNKYGITVKVERPLLWY